MISSVRDIKFYDIRFFVIQSFCDKTFCVIHPHLCFRCHYGSCPGAARHPGTVSVAGNGSGNPKKTLGNDMKILGKPMKILMNSSIMYIWEDSDL